MPPPDRFRYDGFAIDPADSVVTCRYSTADHTFTERFMFGQRGRLGRSRRSWPPCASCTSWPGVSYYKTSAAPLIDLGELPTTAPERDFLRRYYVNGLGEFAYRNGLDLRGLQLEGPDAPAAPAATFEPAPGRPLIPFGGGIDSIVTVASLAGDHPDATLCVVEPPDKRFSRH